MADPDSYPFQNPTSGGAAGHRSRVLGQGETLGLIASEEYGDAKQWRHIATANNIDNPIRLRAGTVLRLPPIENG